MTSLVCFNFAVSRSPLFAPVTFEIDGVCTFARILRRSSYRHYEKLAGQYKKLSDRITAIQKEKDDKEYRAKRISLFIRMLDAQKECLEFDPALFTAFVERVVVSGTKKDVRLT